MVKIILTSDTHLPIKGKQLPSELIEACRTADFIIHAGDWSSMEIVQSFRELGRVVGVYGNVDDEQVKTQLPAQEIIHVKGFNIGIVHGHGDKKTTEQRAVDAFSEEEVDIIVFGHSHIPLIRYVKQVMLINPGSPTQKRRSPYYSYGLLHINNGIKAELVFFS